MTGLDLKTTLRSIRNNKVIFLINVIGLATGLCACIIIILWVNRQYSYNKFLHDRHKVFQLVTNYKINADIQSARATSFPIMNIIESSIPEVDAMCFIATGNEPHSLRITDSAIGNRITGNGYFVSANFFEVIQRPFLFGTAKDALKDPLSVAISNSLAIKLFGENWKATIAGATLFIGETREADINGVFEDFPDNSTIHADYCLPMEKDNRDNIGNYNYDSYVLLKKGVNVQQTQDKINLALQSRTNARIFLQPFSDIYLYSNFSNGKLAGGRIEYVRLFITAAIFILLMACINFMNLYIAASSRKIKEISIKKIAGASQFSIIRQFLVESYFTAFASIVVALIVIVYFMPLINSLTGDKIIFPFKSIWFLVMIFGVLVITGLLAGAYPAFLMTAFKPVNTLKTNSEIKIGGVRLRKGLFVFQFFISIALITFTYGMSEQIAYLKNKNLGFDKKNIIYKPLSQNEIMHLEAIKSSMRDQTYIEDVTTCSVDLQNGGPMVGGVIWPGRQQTDSSQFCVIFADSGFAKTLKIPVLYSSPAIMHSGGHVPVFLNRKATDIMGGPEKILNREIEVWGETAVVQGVIADFHFNSLFTSIQPLIIANLPGQAQYLIARVQEGRQQDAIGLLQTIQHDYSPEKVFTFNWIQNSLDNIYHDEANMERIAGIFSALSILISCLGLLGLSRLTIQKRVRELGIRKTLGANQGQIMALIFGDFSRLIIIAIICAIPLSYYILVKWLSKFAYSFPLSVSTFIYPVALMMAISIMTVLYYCIRISRINPLTSIREN